MTSVTERGFLPVGPEPRVPRPQMTGEDRPGGRLLNVPLRAIGVVIIRVDFEKRLCLAERILVSEGIKAHGILLPEGVVVLQPEGATGFVEDSSDFHRFIESARLERRTIDPCS